MFFPSINNIFALALLAAPLAAAHGKIAVATGDKGGNGTALGSKYAPLILWSAPLTTSQSRVALSQALAPIVKQN
jgi:hypothetical protein